MTDKYNTYVTAHDTYVTAHDAYVTAHDPCLTQWCHVGVVEMSYNKPLSSLLFVNNS
jgi:hypothetical protein